MQVFFLIVTLIFFKKKTFLKLGNLFKNKQEWYIDTITLTLAKQEVVGNKC